MISKNNYGLDLFNDLVNKVKESDFVNNFIDELTDYLKNANEKGETQLNNEQNNNLDIYREENCLYQVVDFSSNGVFLQNTNNDKIFEETNISQELLDKIGNDYILRYKDGKYFIEEELTDNFMNSMVGIQEYRKIKEEFEKESNILEIDSNTKFNVDLRNSDNTILSYGKEKNTIEVPNALIPYFAVEGNVLKYDNGKFIREN